MGFLVMSTCLEQAETILPGPHIPSTEEHKLLLLSSSKLYGQRAMNETRDMKGGGHSPRPLILYFAIKSSWSSAARLALEEKGLKAEMRVLSLFNQEHLTADFLRKNPAATVPVLEVACHGTLLETIPDSLAIVRHLERGDLGGKSLLPEGKEAMAWHWVDRVRTEFQSFRITFGKVTSAAGASADRENSGRIQALQEVAEQHPEIAEAARSKIQYVRHFTRTAVSSEELGQAHAAAWQLLDALEEMLAPGQPYICGDAFSVADVFTVPMLARLQWRNHGQQLRKRPRIFQYWTRIQARPSYLTVFDTPCQMTGHPEDCRCK